MNIPSISSTLEQAFAAAGLNRSPTADKVSETIRKALAAAGMASAPTGSAPTLRQFHRGMGRVNVAGDLIEDLGQFTTHSFSIGSARRAYKLYVPSSYAGAAMPLVVMLHGCKQNPDDFSTGTRMNELAEERGFLVAYPAQTARANGANCWNWFEAAEQSRSGEEASLIAGIAREIGRTHRVDEARVFVAGLSAGAAMAVILGATYPDVFAAIGVHSGLPLGAAHDVPSAFAAMRGAPVGPTGVLRAGNKPSPAQAIPTIVFHGDGDTTVSASNGNEIADRARSAYADSGQSLKEQALPRQSARGREFTTTRYVDGSGRARVEHWVVHGASHAWSGGNADGSYADPQGPDASSEIVRFFLQQ